MLGVYNLLPSGLIIDREKEIQAFVPEEYWTIEGEFLKGKDHFSGLYFSLLNKEKFELKSEEDVQTILKQMRKIISKLFL